MFFFVIFNLLIFQFNIIETKGKLLVDTMPIKKINLKNKNKNDKKIDVLQNLNKTKSNYI